MTDAEKLAKYDALVGLLRDRIELERFYRSEGRGHEAIQFLRANAYKDAVELIIGIHALSGE
jgi:hypothetical protein